MDDKNAVAEVPTVDRKENFIPFRLQDLKTRLLTTYSDHFDDEKRNNFRRFVSRL